MSRLLAALQAADRGLTTLSRVLVYVAGAAVVMLTALVALAAVMRRVVGAPFHFTEELVALLFLATVFLAVPLSIAEKQTVTITVLRDRLPSWAKRVADRLAMLVTLAFALWFLVESWQLLAFTYERGIRTTQTRLELTPWVALIPLTTLLVVLITGLRLFLRHEKPEASEPGQPQSGDGPVL